MEVTIHYSGRLMGVALCLADSSQGKNVPHIKPRPPDIDRVSPGKLGLVLPTGVRCLLKLLVVLVSNC